MESESVEFNALILIQSQVLLYDSILFGFFIRLREFELEVCSRFGLIINSRRIAEEDEAIYSIETVR